MDVPKPSRICSVTQREIQPGESFFSVLIDNDGDVKRFDFAPESWTKAPAEAIGWWKSKLPDQNDKKIKLAPNEILMNLFERLAEEPKRSDMRYVLALLLIRRRLLRYEREEENEAGLKVLVVYAIRENVTYEVPIAMPDTQRIEEVQNELSQLLYS